MAIFSNFFVDINTHIVRGNAVEKTKSIFELFTKKKIGFRFVLFLSVQTLVANTERRYFLHLPLDV